MAVIYNAHDAYDPEIRERKYSNFKSFLKDEGIQFFDLDLRKYFGKPDELEKQLSKADVLWLNGGNTFVLREALAKSGLDTLLPKLLSNGLTYAGDSAGAIVAGPTLVGFEKADDPTKVHDVIWDGLKLTSVIVLPHWGDPNFQKSLEEIEQVYKNSSYQTARLNNQQALLIDGDTIEFALDRKE